MLDTYLAPPGTVATEKGEGQPLALIPPQEFYLLTATITRVVEQEALRLLIWGSADGQEWSKTPLLELPELFYVGEYPRLLHLEEERPAWLRATWEPHRWGRGSETPRFEFELRIRSVPLEVAHEMRLGNAG